MFIIKRKITNSKLIITTILVLLIGSMNVYSQNHTVNVEIEDLLPQYNNYHWTYTGLAGYGHDMAIDSIVIDQMTKRYIISGSVHDLSGGASDTDYSIELEYRVGSDAIVQTKNEEAMMDSKYDEIELIITPLEEGTSWSQEVEDAEGNTTTLDSEITSVEETDMGMIFTVRYDDPNSDYYEERKIQEGKGIVSFEKIMFNEGDSYTAGYSHLESSTGLNLNNDFQDVSDSAWYRDYVAKLITMNLIDGYPDQTFKPDEDISVAEFIKVTVESLSYYPENDSEQWSAPYIEKALELELIEENEFDDYNRPISRAEMTKIIINALDVELQSGQLDFSDANEIDSEYLPYINTAVELGIIHGYPSDNSFRANQTTTRSEASKMFVTLVEQMIEIQPFSSEDALNLEAEFENRLYQETEGDNWVVVNYDDKEDLIDYISEIADRNLAQTYVDDYYVYSNDELTLPPKDGITTILEDRDYHLERIHPRSYSLTQETTTEMLGHYTITVIYHYENEQWIMKDRLFEYHDEQ